MEEKLTQSEFEMVCQLSDSIISTTDPAEIKGYILKLKQLTISLKGMPKTVFDQYLVLLTSYANADNDEERELGIEKLKEYFMRVQAFCIK